MARQAGFDAVHIDLTECPHKASPHAVIAPHVADAHVEEPAEAGASRLELIA